MPCDRDTLLRFIGRDLSGAESVELQGTLDDRPALRAEWERLHALSSALREHRADDFSPEFRSRVMERVRKSRRSTADDFVASLQTMFARMELAAVVSIVGLAVHNLTVVAPPYVAASWIEAVLGLPGTTLESILLFGAM
jgi:hypothetical protein